VEKVDRDGVDPPLVALGGHNAKLSAPAVSTGHEGSEVVADR
jgi:hypothetical protein